MEIEALDQPSSVTFVLMMGTALLQLTASAVSKFFPPHASYRSAQCHRKHTISTEGNPWDKYDTYQLFKQTKRWADSLLNTRGRGIDQWSKLNSSMVSFHCKAKKVSFHWYSRTQMRMCLLQKYNRFIKNCSICVWRQMEMCCSRAFGKCGVVSDDSCWTRI